MRGTRGESGTYFVNGNYRMECLCLKRLHPRVAIAYGVGSLAVAVVLVLYAQRRYSHESVVFPTMLVGDSPCWAMLVENKRKWVKSLS